MSAAQTSLAGSHGDCPNFPESSIVRAPNAATGGKDNLPSDRDVLGALTRTAPEIKVVSKEQREFVARVTDVVGGIGSESRREEERILADSGSDRSPIGWARRHDQSVNRSS